MNEPTKSGVYRQLYHAANSLERYGSLNSSSTTASGTTPMLNTKVLAAAAGIGASLLAVFAAFKSLRSKSDDEKRTESDTVDAFKEALEPDKGPELPDAPVKEPTQTDEAKKPPTPDEVMEEFKPEAEQVEQKPLWKRVLGAIGLSSITGDKPAEETPTANSAPVPATPSTASSKDTGTVLVARGSTLKNGATSERSSQSKNTLFSGKYSRLAKANLNSLELAWANMLVTRGVSISGRMGKSMLPLVRSVIVARAKAHGVDPTVLLRVASMESGGDPNAVSATGAIGVFQFTAATASALGLENRFDLDANVEAGILLMKQNTKSMPADKDQALSAYISHQIGLSSAKEVLSSPPTKLISKLSARAQKAIKVNVGGKSNTVGEYLEANREKLASSLDQQDKAKSFSGKISVFKAKEPATNSASVTVPTPSTSAFVETPASPDTQYQSPKVAASVPPAPTQETKPTTPQSGQSSTVASEEQPSGFFRMKNGLLVAS